MDLIRMRSLLADWGVWASQEGTQRQAKTTPSYEEYIGGDSYGRDYAPDVDVEVLRVDVLIKQLPRVLYQSIIVHYRTPGPLKIKLKGTTRTAHAERLRAAQITLVDMWDEPSDRRSGNKTIAQVSLT